MFLKTLKIENDGVLVRDISFKKGINLIVDNTIKTNKKDSGNNVGKTTILRLIDFCLGGNGENIYKDVEFKKSNTKIEHFLRENNVVIILVLIKNIDDNNCSEIIIRRNFKKYREKIQEINGEEYTNENFPKKLKELFFDSKDNKPSLRQIIAKNIRDEKNKLTNAVRVLDSRTRLDEYEALYLFWLGIDLKGVAEKQQLIKKRSNEKQIQKRFSEEGTLSQIEQSLIVLNKSIQEIESKKNNFSLNKKYKDEVKKLNKVKFEISSFSTELSGLELRKNLIIESKKELENEISKIDAKQIKNLYSEASFFVDKLQRSFEDVLLFHNQMIDEKMKYITKELPLLKKTISKKEIKFKKLLFEEENLIEKLKKTNVVEDLQKITSELNQVYEQKGKFEKIGEMWKNSNKKFDLINERLKQIDNEIKSKNNLIQERITRFNFYFSDISYRLYGERFVLSADRSKKGYELNISSISGNLGTGKKKGQIAAFDLAYIKFADELNIPCLHFILHDQIENIHNHQITSLLTEIVENINCQYILSVLKDKLPKEINVKEHEIISLSQSDKLFKID